MKKIEFYDGSKTYMYPNGEIASPERVQADFPACLLFPHIVETDSAGQVLFSLENLAAVASLYDLEDDLNTDLVTETDMTKTVTLSSDFAQANALMDEQMLNSAMPQNNTELASAEPQIKADLNNQLLPLITKIENLRNTPPTPSMPSAEERIAAALEFQNLLALPDQEAATETNPSLTAMVQKNFEQGLWSEQMLNIAVQKGQITSMNIAEIKI